MQRKALRIYGFLIDLNLASVNLILNRCDKLILDAAMAIISLFNDKSLNQRICSYNFQPSLIK